MRAAGNQEWCWSNGRGWKRAEAVVVLVLAVVQLLCHCSDACMVHYENAVQQLLRNLHRLSNV
jgi:hypothetical protein